MASFCQRAMVGAAVAVVSLVGVVIGGCAVPTERPELRAVSPGQAYSDVPVVLRVGTRNLRPALRVDAQQGALGADLHSLRMRLLPQDTGAGAPPTTLEIVTWNGVDSYWLRVPAGVAAGAYALEVTDARGVTSTLVDAFTGLGPDPSGPAIQVLLPNGGTIGSGEIANAQIVVDDGPGFLDRVRWVAVSDEEHECFTAPAVDPLAEPPAPLSHAGCQAAFTAPVLGDAQPAVVPMSLRVTARDIAGNETVREIPLQVAKIPVVDGFAGPVGALGGRQPFTVRGRFFIPGSEAFIGGVPLISGTLTEHLNGTATIMGWTPPRARAEPVAVEVRSPAGSDSADLPFVYLPPPRPRDIQPPVSPTRGGIRVTVRGNDLRPGFVVVYVGASREVRQPLYNVSYDADKTVLGCVPPGSGTVSLWTYDPVTGDGELPMAFTYQDPPAGGPPPPPIDAACVLK